MTNFMSGVEFFRRVGALAEEEGHHPDLHLEGWNNVAIQLSTHSVGEGLHPSRRQASQDCLNGLASAILSGGHCTAHCSASPHTP